VSIASTYATAQARTDVSPNPEWLQPWMQCFLRAIPASKNFGKYDSQS